MTEQWKQVDEYIAEHLAEDDAALSDAAARADEAGMPPIQVSAPLGRLLELLE